MRRPYPREFRDDVGRVARGREPGVTSEQITKEFGVHAMTSQRWLQRAAVDDRGKPGQSLTERTELRGARKQIWLLERENAVLRRAEASEATKWLSALEKPRGYCLCTPLRRAGSEGRDSPQHVLAGKLWQLPSVFTVQIMGEISPTRCEFAMYQMAIASGITAMTAEIPRRSNRIRVQGATNATAPHHPAPHHPAPHHPAPPNPAPTTVTLSAATVSAVHRLGVRGSNGHGGPVMVVRFRNCSPQRSAARRLNTGNGHRLDDDRHSYASSPREG